MTVANALNINQIGFQLFDGINSFTGFIVIPSANGGTGVNNGINTLTLGGNLTTSGAFASTFTMTAATSVTFPTSGTLATTAQLPTIIATQFDVLVGGAANAIGSVGPGLAGQYLQSGGNAANPAYSTATLPSTATGTGKILIADGTNWVASTPTYPSTAGSSGNVLTSDGTNWSSAAAATGPILSTTLDLTNTQIKALHGTPVQAIAAPGLGKVIVLVSVTGKFVYGGNNAFTAGAGQSVGLYYGTTPAALAQIIPNGTLTGTQNAYTIGAGSLAGTAATSLENIAINAYNPVATEITGNAANNNLINIFITYYIVTL